MSNGTIKGNPADSALTFIRSSSQRFLQCNEFAHSNTDHSKCRSNPPFVPTGQPKFASSLRQRRCRNVQQLCGQTKGRPESHEISTEVHHHAELAMETMETQFREYCSPEIGFCCCIHDWGAVMINSAVCVECKYRIEKL